MGASVMPYDECIGFAELLHDVREVARRLGRAAAGVQPDVGEVRLAGMGPLRGDVHRVVRRSGARDRHALVAQQLAHRLGLDVLGEDQRGARQQAAVSHTAQPPMCATGKTIAMRSSE